MMLLFGAVWVVPGTAIEQFCSIEPCCSMEQPMDCCSIEEPPAPAPDLVLNEIVRIQAPAIDLAPVASALTCVHERSVAIEVIPFASPPPDRLALLSTYLI